MTEQQRREEAIEKIAKIFCKSDISCRDCVKCTIYEGKPCCIHLNNASDIYYYILRKKEEVRKETAKEILDAVDSESYGQTTMITNLLRKKFGVEVEE